MRRIDDQFTRVFDYCAEFVTRLTAYPEFIIVRVEQSYDSFVLSAGVLDVNLPAHFGSFTKCLAYFSGKECVRDQTAFVVTRNHRVERNDSGWNKRSRGFNQAPRRCFDLADDAFNTGKRAEPVSHVRQLGPCNTWEKIFRASSETCDFMRHSRTEHKHRVVNARGKQLIQCYWDCLCD